jgi:hypothetical protein
MKIKLLTILSGSTLFVLHILQTTAQELYKAPAEGAITRWISPENPTGEKGKAGLTNKGAKGNAFYIVAPGETKEILNVEGAGIIQRMWMSGTIAKNAEQRRAVIINMYWDGADKPAVSAPIGDFFGIGLGLMAPFDSELFSNPEGRSFNFTIPMPFRDGAKIEIVNEASSQVLFWYDINFLEMDQIPEDAMYFHTYWNRNLNTELGKDFVILPKVKGKGRYIGTNIGVIGAEAYRGTWFGEGEVKVYLDGDTDHPSLQGTGTEDYIGTGWGQDEFYAQRFGSLISNKEWDIYAFYRYHTADQVYFHEDCKVTIQQMGNTFVPENQPVLKKIIEKGGELMPVWQMETYGQDLLNAKGKLIKHIRFLDMENPPNPLNDDFPSGLPTNFYRRDDVSATAYFYLDRPENNLPLVAPVEVRLKDMKEKVWDMLKVK